MNAISNFDLTKLAAPLSVEQIDFRVQSINKGGYATILAYKDARVDMQRLDDVVGPLYWKREHNTQNRNCVVSIFNPVTGEWISKEDTGTESFAESEKGLASDSFKRACFNWGIGRELYEYPRISIKLNENEFKVDGQKVRQTYELNLHDWRWFTEFDGPKIRMLIAKDASNKVRFEWRDVESVRAEANTILELINQEADLTEVGEAFNELETWKRHLLWTAVTKGGFFNTEQKELIRKAEHLYLNPEEEAA